MESANILEEAFENFESGKKSLQIVEAKSKQLLEQGDTMTMQAIIEAVAKISKNAEGAKLEAVINVSEYLTRQFYSPKLAFCDSIFFPSKANEKKLVKYLKKADDYCYVALYTITNDKLSRVLFALKTRGVEVRIITDDETCHNLGSDITKLANAGIKVRVDPDPQARMHHKFVVLDDELLLNGSFNYTSSAVHKNFENVVVCDHPKLIQDFKAEFLKLWDMNVEGELKGNGEVDPTLIEYANRRRKKHPNRWDSNRQRSTRGGYRRRRYKKY